VTRSDILAWIARDTPRHTTLVDQLAARHVVTASPHEMAITVASRMITHDAPRIPVIDDAGKLCGIISRADLLRVHHGVVAAETKRERFFAKPSPRRRSTSPKRSIIPPARVEHMD